jgi:hypothetical protein
MNPSQHDLESGVQRPTKLYEEAAQRPTNLYEEAHDMLLNAFLMFCIPDIRAMARQDLLKGDKERLLRVVELPATLEDVVTVYEENIELLTKERLKDEKRAEMYKDALTLKKFNLDEKTRKELSRDIFLIHFEDSKEEDECVYCISLNNASKRVGIYFRGSVTKKDFRQDAKAMVGRIDNPVNAVHLLLAEELGVHLGFREYLYKEEKLVKALLPLRTIRKADDKERPTTKDPSLPSLITDKPNTKLELEDERIPRKMKYQIILEQVRELFKEHPDYRLYIAGHSLGGALTTLMALEAGADEAIPKPVTAITSGAPKVGNLAFNRAFEELERQKKLRCLQIANDRDPVPASPPDAWNPLLAMFCQSRRFRHVGLRLKLRSNGYILFSPPKMRTYWGVLLCDCMYVSRTWMIIILFAFLSLFCFASCFFFAIPAVSLGILSTRIRNS